MSEFPSAGGHCITDIARPFSASANPLTDPLPWESMAMIGLPPAANGQPLVFESSQSAEAMVGPLTISLGQIDAPALFVDNKLSIRWLAPGSQDRFSLVLAQQLKAASTRNVFNLLLRPAIKHTLADWRTFFSFIYTRLHRSTGLTALDVETHFISKKQMSPPNGDFASAVDRRIFSVDSCLVGGNRTIDELPLRIFSLKFKQGTLFLLRQDRWQDECSGGVEEDVGISGPQPADAKRPICVLSARLNNAHRLAESMLPELFYGLMNRIWDEADGIVRSLGGRRASCSGAQLCYLFRENAGRNPIFSAICSATRMNRRMALLAEKLKAQHGWSIDICLNMGIGHGNDDPTGPDPGSVMEFVIPGGAFDQSAHLSSAAEKGEIWITKNAISQLPKKLIDQVAVGVYRHGKFLRNFFKRLADLEQAGTGDQPNAGVAALPVARILNIERQNSRQQTARFNHV